MVWWMWCSMARECDIWLCMITGRNWKPKHYNSGTNSLTQNKTLTHKKQNTHIRFWETKKKIKTLILITTHCQKYCTASRRYKKVRIFLPNRKRDETLMVVAKKMCILCIGWELGCSQLKKKFRINCGNQSWWKLLHFGWEYFV